jgi:hypothetical protein
MKISTFPQVQSNIPLHDLIDEIIKKLNTNIITFISDTISYKNLNERIRSIYLEVSSLIRKCGEHDSSHQIAYYEGLSDMLYLYAKTKIHFMPNQNVSGQYLSEKIQIRKRDVDMECLSEEYLHLPLDAIIVEEQKEYENHYMWGQLVGWFKQTVDKPNASLSAERRGTLSYPDLETFFVKDSNKKIFNYPCNSRKNFYNKLIENVSLMWPVGNDWSFKNKQKVYGSVQFDAVYCENYYLDKIKVYMMEMLSEIYHKEDNDE